MMIKWFSVAGASQTINDNLEMTRLVMIKKKLTIFLNNIILHLVASLLLFPVYLNIVASCKSG